MTSLVRRFRSDQRGVSLAVTAVMIMSLLSMIALAFDLGLLRTAKAEAQRAADASALAGASAFLNFVPPATAVQPARNRAYEYALMNEIRNVMIDSAEVTVQVDPNLRRVHVFIRRTAIPMWFARLFGITHAPVAASAMAQASPASRTDCMAPVALPDWWGEPLGGDDLNMNGIPDPNENWQWGNHPGEHYARYFNDAINPPETGFGTLFRNDMVRDQGRLMVIKPQSPPSGANNNNPIDPGPGFFFPIRLPGNADGSTNQGAQDYRNSFTNCRGGPIDVGDTLRMENGNMVGPTRTAIRDLVCLDPNAQWNPTTKQIEGGMGWGTPRLLTITLFDPSMFTQMVGGFHNVIPNNFAEFFIEPIGCTTTPCTVPQSYCQGQGSGGGGQVDVTGRFIQYSQGSGGGNTGTLIMKLQLIQ